MGMRDSRKGNLGVGAVAAVAVAMSGGCGGDHGPRPAWSQDEAWTVGPASVTVAQGPGADFFHVAGAVRLSDGRLVVADGGSSEVRYFAPDGTHLASVGGEGEGPGEYALIQALGPAGGDSVWVYDYGTARITVLTPDGATARTASVTPPLPAGAMVGRRSDGTFVLAQMWGSADPSARVSEGLVREPVVVARYGADGVLVDTLTSVPGREVFHRMEGARMVMSAAPFARSASHALLGDDLVVGDQVTHALEVLGPEGDPVRTLRWAGPALALQDDEVARWEEEQVASAPAADRASVRAYLADMPVPELRPAYGRLLTDAAGCLWVAAYAHSMQDAPRWDVLDAAGRWLGSVDVPARFRPHQIGPDWILGVSRDALDVERLELRPLDRGAGPGC